MIVGGMTFSALFSVLLIPALLQLLPAAKPQLAAVSGELNHG